MSVLGYSMSYIFIDVNEFNCYFLIKERSTVSAFPFFLGIEGM